MMQAFIQPNSPQTISQSDGIEAYMSQMSQIYAIQQMYFMQAQNHIMQSQILNSQSPQFPLISMQQNSTLLNKLAMLLEAPKIVIQDQLPSLKLAFIVKYIANILLHALGSTNECAVILSDPLSITLSKLEWFALCDLIVSKKVFLANNPSMERSMQIVSQSLIFTPEIRSTIFKKLHSFTLNQAEGIVPQFCLKHLNEFLTLESRNGEFLFKFLCEEDKVFLGKEFCYKILNNMFSKVAKYYHSQNLIEQIIDDSSKISVRVNFEKQAEKYLQLVSLYQNSDKKLTIEELMGILFQKDSKIDCREFLRSTSLLQNNLSDMLFMMVDLIKLENKIINLASEDKESETPQKNPLQYYGQLIEKIKNKCKGKEDEFCNCKRCQCIKRNRDSARESQKRKREALEKIGPLQLECEQLEKKVKIVQNRNDELKQVLSDVLRHPAYALVVENNFKDRLQILSQENSTNTSQGDSNLYEC